MGVEQELAEVEKRLAVHEAQCAERWKTIFVRMSEQDGQRTRMENILIGTAAAVIAGGGSVIVTMVMMHGG